jgi:hypothetical protein
VESFLKLSLSDEDKRKILWDNCARFYGAKDSLETNKIEDDRIGRQTLHP